MTFRSNGFHSDFTAVLRDRQLVQEMRSHVLEDRVEGLVLGRRRLLSAGQVGGPSEGGLINPGVLPGPEGYNLICRAEPDEQTWLGNWFDSLATPIWCILDRDLRLVEYVPLSYEMLPADTRAEDWRLFRYDGEIYSNHSFYMLLGDQLHCRPAISRVNLAKERMELLHILEPPFTPTLEEKNWSVFVHNGRLLSIYSFKPYQLLEIDLEQGTTTAFIAPHEPNFSWYDKGRRFIANSTNPVRWDELNYVMFIHDYLEPGGLNERDRTYMQYAVLISRQSLLPVSVIAEPLLMGGSEDGRHKGVHYTMSLVCQNDYLMAFYGEGDSHTGVVKINALQLNELFASHQLTPIDQQIEENGGIG